MHTNKGNKYESMHIRAKFRNVTDINMGLNKGKVKEFPFLVIVINLCCHVAFNLAASIGVALRD